MGDHIIPWGIDDINRLKRSTMAPCVYRQTFSMTRIKSRHLNISRLVLQLSLPNPLKPGVNRQWRCSWSSADRRCSNYIWVINKFIACEGATYIRGLTARFGFIVEFFLRCSPRILIPSRWPVDIPTNWVPYPHFRTRTGVWKKLHVHDTPWIRNVFRITGLCEGNPQVTATQIPVMPAMGSVFLAWTSCYTSSRVTGDLRHIDGNVTCILDRF